jgi:hypothetical protein
MDLSLKDNKEATIRKTLHLLSRIKYICNNLKTTADMFVSYISEIDSQYDSVIEQKIEAQFYDIKYLGKKRRYTSKNAILLAKKIKEIGGGNCYPMIEVTGTKGCMDKGCWSWSMFRLDTMSDIGSCEPVSWILRKKVILDFSNDGIEITCAILPVQKKSKT